MLLPEVVIQRNWAEKTEGGFPWGCGGRDDPGHIDLCQTVFVSLDGTKLFPFTLSLDQNPRC